MLPAEAQDHERIRAHFNSALNAMNSAVEGIPLQYSQPASAAAAGTGYGYAGGAGDSQTCCNCTTPGRDDEPAAAMRAILSSGNFD